MNEIIGTKKSKGKNIFIVILIILILGLVGYIIYDKMNKKDVEPESGVNISQEELTEDLDIIAEGLKNFIDQKSVRNLISVNEFPDVLDFKKETIDSKSVYGVIRGMDICLNDSESKNCKLNKSQLDEYFKTTFNIEGVEYKDFICPIDNLALFSYNANEGYYSRAEVPQNMPDHGHEWPYYLPSPIYTKIDSLEKVNDEYILTISDLYVDEVGLEEVENSISADPKGKTKIFELEDYKMENGTISYAKLIADYENTFESNKVKYPKFKYTFKKNEEGKFYLTKYEEEKGAN